jgi:uncharacterized membrane protein
MSEKRSKYDTDPLDPDFARQTDEMWGATRATQPRPMDEAGDAAAQSAPRPLPPSEAPTQRMDEKFSQSYPSIFIPPTYNQPPTVYQQPVQYQQPYAPPQAGVSTPGYLPERTIAGLNIAEKYATVLPYAPFYIGLVAALIELLLVPRRETRVRFHAAQGLALQLALLAVSWVFSFIGFFTHSRFGGSLLWLAGFVFLIISMKRVWKGQEHRIGPLSDATKWLNERIDPRKS